MGVDGVTCGQSQSIFDDDNGCEHNGLTPSEQQPCQPASALVSLLVSALTDYVRAYQLRGYNSQ